jgi:hypothetical protein
LQRHLSPASGSIQEEGSACLLDALLGEALAFLSFFQQVDSIHDGPYRSDERNAIDVSSIAPPAAAVHY